MLNLISRERAAVKSRYYSGITSGSRLRKIEEGTGVQAGSAIVVARDRRR